jgi:hypothetical protein
VYAYVLMSHHVHLLIETGAVGLSKILQGIQFSYTQRYNCRHRVVGQSIPGCDVKPSCAIAMRICWSWLAISI